MIRVGSILGGSHTTCLQDFTLQYSHLHLRANREGTLTLSITAVDSAFSNMGPIWCRISILGRARASPITCKADLANQKSHLRLSFDVWARQVGTNVGTRQSSPMVPALQRFKGLWCFVPAEVTLNFPHGTPFASIHEMG